VGINPSPQSSPLGEEEVGRVCHPKLVSGSLTERTEEYPLLEERDRVRSLTEQEQSEILRSSSADLFQSDGISLRMTNTFDNHNKCRHPEQSEGSLTKRVQFTTSPPYPLLKEREITNYKGHPELRILARAKLV